MSLKGDLLEQCASCEPRNFLQVDSWPAGLLDWECGAVAMDVTGRSLTAALIPRLERSSAVYEIQMIPRQRNS